MGDIRKNAHVRYECGVMEYLTFADRISRPEITLLVENRAMGRREVHYGGHMSSVEPTEGVLRILLRYTDLATKSYIFTRT